MLEQAQTLDLSQLNVEVNVDNAYTKGSVPISLALSASVRVDATEPGLSRAIERFLGQEREQIRLVAEQTLEGNARTLIATLTVEELEEFRDKAVESLESENEGDFVRLGLSLETLQIHSITALS